MRYKDFIRQLPAAQRRQLTEKSNAKGFIHLGIHIGALLLTGTSIYQAVPYWQLLLIPHGILLIFLFTLLHETIHRTAFATRIINDYVANICGFLLFIPPEWFRAFHFAHHRHTQDPAHDPELFSKAPSRPSSYILHISGLPVWYGQFRSLVQNAIGLCSDPYVPNSKLRTIRRESRVMLVLYVSTLVISILFLNNILLFLWVLPALVGQPFLRLYLLAEHGNCPYTSDIFANTRTTYTTRLIRRLAWNMPYHAEHHAYPSVPFFRLPQLNCVIRDKLEETESGYLSFNSKYLSNLK